MSTQAPIDPPSADPEYQPMQLDRAAVSAARERLDQGAVTPHDEAFSKDIARMLNESLATELISALRYKRHHFTATGMESLSVAEIFLAHAGHKTTHADQLAERIVQLQGSPDFSPDSLTARSHVQYDEAADLKAMVRANLIAERVSIEVYSQLIDLIGQKDSTTRRLLQTILRDAQAHADELADLLQD